MKSNSPTARLSFKDRKSFFLLQAVGREFPDIDDYWDGNWILIKASLGMPGLSVQITDPCIRVDELEAFLLELQELFPRTPQRRGIVFPGARAIHRDSVPGAGRGRPPRPYRDQRLHR